MNVTFDHATEEAPNIFSFFFKPEKPVQYIPGQFTELAIPHDSPDDRGVKRWFTLSSSPTDELLSITTRIVSDTSSFKKALTQLKKGTTVTMAEPMGDFVLPRDPAIPVVFVAAGIGVTPFHSILKWLHDSDEARTIRFLHAVKTEDDIIYQQTFEDAGVHATIIVEQPTEAWGGERGRLTGEHALKLAEPASNSLLYLAGPKPFVESLQQQVVAQGFPREQIVVDSFPGYSSL